MSGREEKIAIQQLKDRFAEEPVIASFHEDRPNIVETDTSDTAVGAAHFQLDENGKLHPVVYYSEKYSLAEQNYDIYEKELIAIVKALKADTLSKQPGYERDKVYKKVAIFREDKDGNLVPNTKEIAALSRTKGL
ncbi:uncharacterized protein BP5553_08944 [Venustampulla echinocandica]|uniref:Reverse transcriptase/retrotransposon-derived protein RNase H-like domain-containing protein n=1 Tax=Venustampulla echinocandica TaxID=2656787 RepID=A0A370TDD1_9HELO|nr:uncharacterized protein BP5553_08944 [Venustampulla echinocandica]RDL32488.1 hypothetical protein BP5553_08944 [Venustampulla echinocandica]